MRKKPNNIRRYFGLYKDQKRDVFLGVISSVVHALVFLPVPLIFRYYIDKLIPASDIKGLLFYGILVCVLVAAYVLLGLYSSKKILVVTKKVIFHLRSRVCMKLQHMCLGFYDNVSTGKLHARAMIDTENIDVASNFILRNLIVSVVVSITGLTIMLYMNYKLAIVILLFFLLLIIGLKQVVKKLRVKQIHLRQETEKLSSRIGEILNSILLIKTFSTEDREKEKTDQRIAEYLRKGIAASLNAMGLGLIVNSSQTIGTLIIFVVGGIFVMKGTLTIGGLIAFTSMMGFLFGPISQIFNSVELIGKGEVSLDAVYELLDFEGEERSREGVEIEGIKGKIEFKNVKFSYGKRLTLKNINVVIKPGEKVALVGESGAGKTSFIRLILGFYRPQTGEILVDGNNINKLNLHSFRKRIGVVSQENILLKGSIADNIRYGKETATIEEIQKAAKDAYAHDFIAKTRNGYETEIGEKGVKLSMGQKQRIAIARMILKSPEVLILDEATSALDSESEVKVQKGLEHLLKNSTAIIIAHRLSTVQNVDKIFVFKNGQIVEQGSHQALLENRGTYYKQYESYFKK